MKKLIKDMIISVFLFYGLVTLDYKPPLITKNTAFPHIIAAATIFLELEIIMPGTYYFLPTLKYAAL